MRYTMAEFVQFYGGTREWENAQPVPEFTPFTPPLFGTPTPVTKPSAVAFPPPAKTSAAAPSPAAVAAASAPASSVAPAYVEHTWAMNGPLGPLTLNLKYNSDTNPNCCTHLRS